MNIVPQIVLALCSLAILAPLSRMIGIWILRPVDRAAKDHEHPTQFTIVDFFCLFFIIQLAMAIIHWQLGVGPGAQMKFVYLFDAFSWFACGALWMKSVQLMSRAGIQKARHRVLFLAVIIPGTLAAVMIAPILLSFWLGIIVSRPTNENHFNLNLVLAILSAMPPILYALARLTRMIVAAAEPPLPKLVDVELVE